MPNSKRRTPKSPHRPAKTTIIAAKTDPIAPIYPHIPPPSPTQIRGNERK